MLGGIDQPIPLEGFIISENNHAGTASGIHNCSSAAICPACLHEGAVSAANLSLCWSMSLAACHNRKAKPADGLTTRFE